MDKILETFNNILNQIMSIDYIKILSNLGEYLTFEALLKLIIIYFFIVWIAIIIWVTKDIINRTNNILIQIISILTVLIGTPLGAFVYLLIRPSKTLFEKYYEETSMDDDKNIIIKNNDDENISLEDIKYCTHCDFRLRNDFKFCPNCGENLKKDCIGCKKEIETGWEICPYCGKNQKEQENKEKKDSKEEVIIKQEEIEKIENKETIENKEKSENQKEQQQDEIIITPETQTIVQETLKQEVQESLKKETKKE